jgi:uncharacterized protein YbcI
VTGRDAKADVAEVRRPTVEVRASPDRGADWVEGSPADGKPAPLKGGQLLAAISNRIVAMLHEHYGRGPIQAKTYVLDDMIVVVMRGSGFIPLEQTIMDSGEPERVLAIREDFQRVMASRFQRAIEELTGRNVVAFVSPGHIERDITMEIFFIDGPLQGFGEPEISKRKK